MSEATFTWIQAVGVLAQVVTAIVAIVLAYRANQLNKESLFLERIISELFDILISARAVNDCYVRLFGSFPTVKEKQEARSQWLKERERVSVRLREISQLLPEIETAAKAWAKLEEEEDTHARGDGKKIADAKVADEAKKRYERAHSEFVTSMATLMKSLRR